MKIDWKTLCENSPVGNYKLVVSAVLSVVHKNYCDPMTVRGLCTENCSDCKLNLTQAFSLDEALNPYSLLGWTLRNELAKRQEVKHEAKVITDQWGVPAPEDNPFKVIGRQLESSTSTR